jgi:transcriptional regulator with XRE-family HTH domain
MKTIVQQLREEKNLTQTELAERSGLSLRTIQRIEAGNIPKGFTLKSLAKTFEIETEKLFYAKEILKIDRAKLINLSALMGLIIPFGGVILSPFIQKGLSLNYPLFLIPLLTIISIKLLIIIINGISLNKNNDLHKNLKINYL